MAGVLVKIFDEWASSPCDERPCGLSIWDYCALNSGRDLPPLPPHQTRQDVVNLLRPYGGLEGYVRHLMDEQGWEEVDEPVQGDVGLIKIKGLGTICAIKVDNGWAVRGNRLVAITAADEVLGSWRI